jgi:hypothetical protein
MTNLTFSARILALFILLGCQADLMSQREDMDVPSSIVVRVLSEGSATGGVELSVGCEPERRAHYALTGETKLMSLQATVPTLRWKKNAGIYRIQIGQDSTASLMHVSIPPTTLFFSNVKDATDQLFSRPEVDLYIRKTRLKLFAAPVGYSSNPRLTNSATTKQLYLASGTIADDADQIGITEGQKIWLYSSSSCNGASNGRFQWLH